MNKILKTTLVVCAVLVMAGGLFVAGSMFGMYRNGMLGYERNMPGYNPPNGGNYGSGGMMGRRGNGYGSEGMMPGFYGSRLTVTPLSVDKARQAAENYLENLANDDLVVSEVMIFDNNAYVVIKETSTDMGAFELLIDPTSQIAYPEMGPNMMWNLKYGSLNHGGMMGERGSGMMGNRNSQNVSPADVSADMPVSQEQAIKNAQAYLDQALPGAIAADDPVKFYGYYTLDFERDGKVVGMLSVNGFDGQMFLHTWHGTFIEESAIQ